MKTIQIRLSEVEHTNIKLRATQAHMSITDYVMKGVRGITEQLKPRQLNANDAIVQEAQDILEPGRTIRPKAKFGTEKFK